jgi:hypothetical protein
MMPDYTPMNSGIPIDVRHLLPVLHEQLITLLGGLIPEQWQARTVAKLWTVKDVATHAA